jgi:hypothetical protein
LRREWTKETAEREEKGMLVCPEEIEQETTLTKEFHLGAQKRVSCVTLLFVRYRIKRTSKKKLSQQVVNLPNIRSPGSSWDVLFHWAITSGR